MAAFRVLLATFVAVALVSCGSDEPEPRQILVAQVTESGLVVFDAETGERFVEEEADPAAFIAVPRFSADGTNVVHYYSPDDGEGQPAAHLAVVDIESGERHLSPQLSFLDATTPTWSPDGTRVASGTADIVMLDAEMRLLTEPKEPEPLTSQSGPLLDRVPWSPDSQFAATVDDEGITVAHRDGDVFTVDVEALAQDAPSGVGFDPLRDRLQVVAWQDGATLRLFIMRSGRVRPSDDGGPEIQHVRADGTIDNGRIVWKPPVEITCEDLLAAHGAPDTETRTEVLDKAAAAAELSLDYPSDILRSADDSTWVVGMPYDGPEDGRGLGKSLKLIVLVPQAVVIDLAEGRFASQFRNGLDVVVTGGD